ncbi:MAG: DNA repair protein RecN [Vulcanimicrobiaceae bacterium]
MLRRLHIENFALISNAELLFGDGVTMITGETGSGKTMLLGALLFAVGERASSDFIGRHGDRVRVTLSFDLDEPQRAFLVENGFDLEPGEMAEIVRELHANGKSSLRVNGRASTAGFAREFAPQIFDVVGQHEAQRLLAPRYHLALLDRFGGRELLDARDACASAYARWAASRDALHEVEAMGAEARRRYDDATETLAAITEVSPEFGEARALRERAKLLASAQRVAAALAIAHEALADDDGGAVTAIGSARTALDGIRSLATHFESLTTRLDAVQNELVDCAAEISKAANEIEYDGGETERINERIDALDRLERRFGGSIDAVFAVQTQAQAIIDAAELSEEHRTAALARHDADERVLRERASQLRVLRKSAANALETAVAAELGDLALASAKLTVVAENLDAIAATGDQRISLMFRANSGDAAHGLAHVASGGELSRVLLALIVALAGSRERTALVFDEIDAGIGGATATAVGTRIARLGKQSQVVCVTHLAQIAVHADVHAVLEKHDDADGASITLRMLASNEERVDEIARMLSGESHRAAKNHAREMLRNLVDF